MEATDREMTIEDMADRLIDEPESEEDQEDAPAEPTEPDLETDDPITLEEPDDEPDDGEEIEDDSDADDEADDEEAEEEQPQVYTVKVDGQERQVTLEDLQRGYAGQEYVQEGMRKNAEQRREIEAYTQQLQQHAQAILTMRQQAEATGFLPAPQPPDPAMEREDPLGYLQEWTSYQRRASEYQQQQQYIAQVQQFQQQAQEQQKSQYIAQQRERLAEAFPEIKTAEGAKSFISRTMEGAQKHFNLSKEVLDQVTDADAVVILDAAIRWKELQASKPSTRKKVEAAPRAVKPKARKSSRPGVDAKSRIKRAREVGTVEAWADALAE